MGEVRFRVRFGDRAASTDQLERIESIEVTQEMDAFWEARIRMSMCLDDKGVWRHRPDQEAEAFSRIRIELDAGSGRFVPLIDGPLVSVDGKLDSQPGRSTAALVVRDDSAFLHRDEEIEPSVENRRDSEIAEQLFRRFGQIKDIRVEATSGTHENTQWRGTALEFLRKLAKANDRHAYVLPGNEPGESVGCFLPDPDDTAFPKLVLIGDDRNISEAAIEQDPDGPQRTRASVLRISDRGTVRFETSSHDLGLMRDLPALPADLTPRRLLHPADNTRKDPEAAVSGQARRAGYVYRLSGRVVPGCYSTVLSPYAKVNVEAGATPYSGVYLITKVVHRIAPSLYTQQFEAKADSLTEVSVAGLAGALGGGLSTAISVSGGIF
jgi:hypothetical protein